MSSIHRVPAIDRMMGVLATMAVHEDGLSMNQIAEESGLSRSTVYRLLNSLESHRLVSRRGGDGRFVIGVGFLQLAARVQQRLGTRSFLARAQPFLERVSARTGEVSKLSVLDADRALCLVAVSGSSPYSLMPAIGEHYPIHAGAASKVLLAAQPRSERERILRGRLEGFTEHTVTARPEIEAELAAVRRQGWAEDRGEFKLSVRAIAAPVVTGDGTTVAALSVAYLADLHAEKGADFCRVVVAVAKELSGAVAET